MTPGEVEEKLMAKYKINPSPTVWENIGCIRVTPHVYTTLADLDKLVKSLGDIAAEKKDR